MRRDVSTPLLLWICAALCAHFLLEQGGSKVAEVAEDRSELRDLVTKARERTLYEEQSFEIAINDEKTEEQKPLEEKKDEPKPPETKDPSISPPSPSTSASPLVPPTVPPPPPPPPPPKVEPPKPPAPPPPKPPEAEKKKVVVEPKPPKPEDKKPPPKLPDPVQDHRVAVNQQVEDPNQKNDPNAHYIGDHANVVKQETVATATNLEKDEKNPTPAGVHAGADPKRGDSDKNHIAQSEERAGTHQRSPGDKGTEFDITKDSPPPSQVPPSPNNAQPPPAPFAPTVQQPHDGDNHPLAPAPSQAPQPPDAPPPAPGGEGVASPSVQDSPNGSWSFNPARPNTSSGSGSASQQGPGAASQPPPAPVYGPMFGLGAKVPAGQPNFNLNQSAVASIVGTQQLNRERVNDGERRKSEHRGTFMASNFDKWRSAIENYVTTVKPGNQTALNTAAVPFATYLNLMHNRIHPIFADSFLGSLDSLPRENPLNDPRLVTRLEIVLTKDGQLHKMGIVKTSGVTAFDIAALDAVNRAAPFGPAPGAIVSPDGNVYLHWEFHRDEVFACSTMNARPFMLNTQAPTTPVDPQPPPPGPQPPTLEPGLPTPTGNTGDTRQGRLSVMPDPHAG